MESRKNKILEQRTGHKRQKEPLRSKGSPELGIWACKDGALFRLGVPSLRSSEQFAFSFQKRVVRGRPYFRSTMSPELRSIAGKTFLNTTVFNFPWHWFLRTTAIVAVPSLLTQERSNYMPLSYFSSNIFVYSGCSFRTILECRRTKTSTLF